MTTDSTELTFVRCPSCRSLVPAVSTRCRMCGTGLQGSGAGESAEDRRSARVRQRTMTVSSEDAQRIREEIAASMQQQQTALPDVAEPQIEPPPAVEPEPVYEAAPVVAPPVEQEVVQAIAPVAVAPTVFEQPPVEQPPVTAAFEAVAPTVVEPDFSEPPQAPPAVEAAPQQFVPAQQEPAAVVAPIPTHVMPHPEVPAVIPDPVVPQEVQAPPPVIAAPPVAVAVHEESTNSEQEDMTDSFVDESPPVVPTHVASEEVRVAPVVPVQQPAEAQPTPAPESVAPPQTEPRKGGFSLGGQFGKKQGLSFARPKSEAVPAAPKAEAPPQTPNQPKQEAAMQDSRKGSSQEAPVETAPPREPAPQQRAAAQQGGERPQPQQNPQSPGAQSPGGHQDRPAQQQKARPDFGMSRNQGQNNGPSQGGQSSGQERSGERREREPRPQQNGAPQQQAGGGNPRHQAGGQNQQQAQQAQQREQQPNREREQTRQPAPASNPVPRTPVGTRPSMNLSGRLFGWLVTYADSEGSAIELREGKIMVTGSSLKDTDLVISDRSISTPHAMITISPAAGFMIQDLISDRGVWVRRRNEETYRREEEGIEVFHGDWIRLGDVEFMVALIANVGEK